MPATTLEGTLEDCTPAATERLFFNMHLHASYPNQRVVREPTTRVYWQCSLDWPVAHRHWFNNWNIGIWIICNWVVREPTTRVYWQCLLYWTVAHRHWFNNWRIGIRNT